MKSESNKIVKVSSPSRRQGTGKVKKVKRHTVREYNRATRRIEADTRKTERDELSPLEQLKKLDAKLGKGYGAKRERSRLTSQLKQHESIAYYGNEKSNVKKTGKR